MTLKNATIGVCIILVMCHLVFSRAESTGSQPPLFKQQVRLGENNEWRNAPVLYDINGDGLLDIIATKRRPLYENSLHLWLAAQDGSWKELPQHWISPGYSGIDVADLNKDGTPDIVAGSHFNRIHTFIGKSPGVYQGSVMPTADGYVAVKLADLDGDGICEAVLMGNEKAGVEIYKWNGSGWDLKNSLSPGFIGRAVQIADMNRDGRPDIVALIAKRGVVIFLQQDGLTWAQAPETGFFSATDDFHSLAVADLNGDGWPDIALNGGWEGAGKLNGPDVYLSLGAGGKWTPSSANLKIFKKPAEGIAIGDFNHDGKPDLIVGGNNSNTVAGAAFGLFLFTGDGSGGWTLQEHSGLPAAGLVRPYGMIAQDINKDGRDDLVSLHSDPEGDAGYVSVFMAR